MEIDFVTKEELQQVKKDIIDAMSGMLEGKTEQRQWLRSADVRKMLNISSGTLQNFRINGVLKFSKMGGTLFYAYDDVMKALNDKKLNTA